MFRRRQDVGVCLIVVVAAGLASRVPDSVVPVVVARYAGDVLWATALFLALGFVWPSARTRSLALAAALISLLVELSQLTHPAWLDELRSRPGVGLLLGYDFLASDLACYVLGVILGGLLDRFWLRRAPTGSQGGSPGTPFRR